MKSTTVLLTLLLFSSGISAQAEDNEDESPATGDIPELISTNSSLTLNYGDSLELVCQVNQMNQDYQLMFRRLTDLAASPQILAVDSMKITRSVNFTIEPLTGGLEGMRLIIHDLKAKDSGLYTCSVTGTNKIVAYEVKVSTSNRGRNQNAASTVLLIYIAVVIPLIFQKSIYE